MKKITTIILMVMMLIGISSPLMAQTTQETELKNKTTSITIEGLEVLEGKNYSTVDVYKVIDGQYDNNGKLGGYSWNYTNINEFNNIINKYSTQGVVNGEFFALKDNSKELMSLTNAMAAILATQSSNPYKTVIDQDAINDKNTLEGTVEIDGLGIGAYVAVIKNDKTDKIYNPIFIGITTEDGNTLKPSNVKFNIKSSEITLTKSADKSNTYIGDVINFTITLDVPNYLSNAVNKMVVVEDNLPDGLTLDKTSIKVSTSTNVDLNSYFTKTDNLNGFKLELKQDTYDKFNENLISDRKINISYNATVNKSAKYVFNGQLVDSNLLNEVKYTYNSYQHAIKNAEKNANYQLYIYDMTISKKAYNDTAKKSTSSAYGTEFKLFNKNDLNNPIKFSKDDLGNYIYQGLSSEATLVDKVMIDKDSGGQDLAINIKGLPLGEYVLKEVTAPQIFGFALPQNPDTNINLVGDKALLNNTNTVVTGTNLDKTSVKTSNNNLSFTIENYKGEFNIPNTGGVGTTIFTVGGLLIMASAIAIIVIVPLRKRHH